MKAFLRKRTLVFNTIPILPPQATHKEHLSSLVLFIAGGILQNQLTSPHFLHGYQSKNSSWILTD